MPDHGRPIAFGYFLVPDANTPLLATAAEAEARGLDYIGIQDHPYQRRYVDTVTLLGLIAGRTSRIGLFPDVANLPLRPPAVLAKTAASLDVLSGGRFELGLGAGGFWDAIEAYGGPRRTPAEALNTLDEGIQVIRKIWSGERNLRFTGRHYQLKGAQWGPVPMHEINLARRLRPEGVRHVRVLGRWTRPCRGRLSAVVVAPSMATTTVFPSGHAPSSTPAMSRRCPLDEQRRDPGPLVWGRGVGDA